MKKITASVRATQKIARDLSYIILHVAHKKAVVVGLSGELGSGKTVFAKGFAKGFGIKEIITSPTFIIMKKIQIPRLRRGFGGQAKSPPAPRLRRTGKFQSPKFKNFIHIDAYRVKSRELVDLGFRELIRHPENIILIEWADRVKKILPKKTILIQFETLKKNQRKIFVKNNYGER